ncbi:MAG: 50S ribosomal protein L4 [bacterium]|nr:50S ribosomal protein L4 [bacterium]
MDLDPKIFGGPVRRDLLHTVVVAQLNARRRGTSATKNRALVSGGGKKPFKQKGTGRARQGTTRASQFAGGGVVFGPQPRTFEQRIPKKVRKAALRSVLSLRKSEDRVWVVDSIDLPEVKTKLLASKLAEMETPDALIVTKERDHKLELAGRNLKSVNVLPVAGLNVRDVLARKNLILMRDAVDAIVERLQ